VWDNPGTGVINALYDIQFDLPLLRVRNYEEMLVAGSSAASC
jgi:hypothetical protein